MIKVLFGAFWGALLVYGAMHFMSHSISTPQWVYYGSVIGRNYRLSDADSPYLVGRADRSAYVGRYLREQLEWGKILTPRMLAAAPEINVPVDTVPVFVSLKSQPIPLGVNADATVAVWKGQARLLDSVSALALACPAFSSPATECQVVLALNTSDAKTLSAEKDKAQLLLIAHSKGRGNE
jgi:hypothetical protein